LLDLDPELENVSLDDQIAELGRITDELERYQRFNKLEMYQPYEKQMEFHAAGPEYRERMLMAANQVGKTVCAGAEVAMHMTGRYPDWWTGLRFAQSTKWWIAGVTGETTRDNPQRILLGQKREYGTGMIPMETLESVQLARGTPDAVDNFTVRHVSGGLSYGWFKSYEKGREKWQGETLDGIWDDEEPPQDIYTEGLTRLNVTRGPMMITFTPLLGMSEVVRAFLQPKQDGKRQRFYVNMTLEDAHHYTPEQRQEIIDQYPEHEKDARTKGIPMLGSGRIYPVHEEFIRFELTSLAGGFPSYWRGLGAVDFGDWDHPTAAVFMRHDRDTDTIYLYDCYRVSREKLAVHAKAIRARGKWLPMAWPHDGHKHDGRSGLPIAKLWRDDGVKMHKEHATHEAGGFSVEAGITEILDRMATGRFKVASHLNDWWDEFRMYHRKDGKIVKERDDLMDATRYGVMMLRIARLPGDSNYRPEALTTGQDFNVLG
jgi:phage terminase large subunit-like protein